MNELERIIADRIRAEGPLPFTQFMTEALYHPGLGYYTSAETEIGRKGDYYTSPHLSPVFGTVQGRQILEMWRLMKRPSSFTVVEPGAGRGYLALDMLRFFRDSELWDTLRFVIVEVNPALQKRQRTLLREFESKVEWISSPKELQLFRGVVISNEVLDALPVHLVEMTEGGLKEIFVEVEKGRFVEKAGPPSTKALSEYLEEFNIELRPGYRTEINLAIRDWLAAYAEKLAEGYIITVDYGYPAWEYYGEERSRGTLLCYYEHQTNEAPFRNIGHQDITAHVNFSSVKTWGNELGMKTLGFCRQGPFLVSLGLDEVVMKFLDHPPPEGFNPLNVKGLVMPGTMGETHKVLILFKGRGAPQLQGFVMKNELFKLMD